MEEKEYSNIYAIPANYTDSGKIFGGLLELRNAVETVFLILLIGYPELRFLALPFKFKIVLMTLTILPVAVLSMMGIDGDSLFVYISHMAGYVAHRRKLHFRRVGYRYDPKQVKNKKKQTKSGSNKTETNTKGYRSGKKDGA